jgi:uracil-DNA glycosylase family 4
MSGDCHMCGLRQGCRGPVWGDGTLSEARVGMFGEAPGKDEDLSGRPFVGKAGREQDNYLMMGGTGLSRSSNLYVSNVVKCRPPDNRDPSSAEIGTCRGWFLQELAGLHPDALIASVGGFSTRSFLGPVDLEVVHSIPHWVDELPDGLPLHRWVLPIYHPAAGLHDTSMMLFIKMGYDALGAVLRGDYDFSSRIDPWPSPIYHLVNDVDQWFEGQPPIVAIDTESYKLGGYPWGLSLSTSPGTGAVIRADSPAVAQVRERVKDPNLLVVLHNALYDLPVLAMLGIVPARWTDTMQMAYLLGDLPLRLKALAYRLCAMKMEDYDDLIRPISTKLAVDYFREAQEMVRAGELSFPKPAPILERKPDGTPRIKQPQPVEGRINRLLLDYDKGELEDPRDRFMSWSDREAIEAILGELREGNVGDLPIDKAVWYAGRDADATLRVFHKLAPRIKDEGLSGVLERDLGMMPMVSDMTRYGMPVNLDTMAKLRSLNQERGWQTLTEIERMAGRYVNPNSPKQVAEVLKQFGVGIKKKTKTGQVSTSKKVIEGLRGEHRIVDLICSCREYGKLIDSFIDPISRAAQADPDRRVHPSASTTTVATGRLAMRRPNLMAIPVRTQEGRELRDAFEAEDGFVFLSGDYSQVEMRVIAHDSQDPVMMDIFWRGADIHSETAAGMFEIPVTSVEEMAHRYPAKRVGFGILNDISAMGLQREFFMGGAGWWEEGKCQDLIDRWFRVYAGVRRKMDDYRLYSRRHREIRDMHGRRRWVPEVVSVHPYVVEAGLRQAANAPIQMGAQGIIKEAMRQLVPVYSGFKGSIRPLIQIHDDLVWEVEEGLVGGIIPIIKDVMENAVKLSVPILVDFKAGKRWGSMAKIKEV